MPSLSGNWQISLQRMSNPQEPLVFSGFLVQSGSTITGAVLLGSGCSGVGPVTGQIDGQNLSLTIGEFGQDINLTGTIPAGGPSPSTFISGQFSNLAGGCTNFPNTGTWSAVQISPITGSYHGKFVSAHPENGNIDVTGTLNQGPNIGGSSASVMGNITQSAQPFCSYLTLYAPLPEPPVGGDPGQPIPGVGQISGFVSGSTVVLKFFNEAGAMVSQVTATLSADAKSLTGPYVFRPTSSTCTGDQGTVTLTFP